MAVFGDPQDKALIERLEMLIKLHNAAQASRIFGGDLAGDASIRQLAVMLIADIAGLARPVAESYKTVRTGS